MWMGDARIESDDAADHLRLGTILATISIAFTLLWPFYPPYPSIVGIIIGHIARIRISEFSHAKIGSFISTVGLFLGYIGVALFMLLPEDALPRSWGAQELARRASCQHNLKQIWYACQMYSDAHDGQLPSSLSKIYPEPLNLLSVFRCPSLRRSPRLKPEEIDSRSSYELVPLQAGQAHGKQVFIRERWTLHDGGRNYMYLDGHVAFVTSTD